VSTIHINVADELRQRLETRATESGFASVEQYAEAVLRADVGEYVDSEVEQMLLERLDDPRPDIPFDEHFRNAFWERVRQRRAGAGR
jgi:hypothetical protein